MDNGASLRDRATREPSLRLGHSASVPSAESLIEKLARPHFRDQWLRKTVREGLAFQIRALRAARGWTIDELAARMGKSPLTVSRYENPDYDGQSLNTLFAFASAFDVALIVRFVDWKTLLAYQLIIAPEPYGFDIFPIEPAQAMSASGQDPEGLEAKPASAVAESDAP